MGVARDFEREVTGCGRGKQLLDFIKDECYNDFSLLTHEDYTMVCRQDQSPLAEFWVQSM